MLNLHDYILIQRMTESANYTILTQGYCWNGSFKQVLMEITKPLKSILNVQYFTKWIFISPLINMFLRLHTKSWIEQILETRFSPVLGMAN